MTSIYRKIWELHYGPIPKDEKNRSLEIHHIDGNHSNNNINNLQLVTIEEHYDIHYKQEDWGACVLIANQRLNKSAKELNRLQKKLGKHNGKLAKEKVKNNKHHWQTKKHKERMKKLALRKVKNGTNPFLWLAKEQIKNGTHNFLMKWTCPHCKKKGSNQTNLIRWHGDNCKFKD